MDKERCGIEGRVRVVVWLVYSQGNKKFGLGTSYCDAGVYFAFLGKISHHRSLDL